ncbi:MAG: DMT family transporter [Janthinobacterium lividum]
MQYLLIALIALSGIGLPVQDALNAQLRTALKSPMLGAFLSLLVGAVVLGILSAFGVMGQGKLSEITKVHWWVCLGGGLIGAFAVTIGLIGIPKVSAGIVIAATVFGQLLSAVVIDHFGWFGVPRVPLNPWRIAGALGLFVCVLMMQKK